MLTFEHPQTASISILILKIFWSRSNNIHGWRTRKKFGVPCTCLL